ncbi:hypothetical protein SE19_04350 [Acidiplasma aeolicum]|uniref:Uncharacterized protein n=1 Tax=Acidiplasma aeolicum TaxID=507754 RepID=A0A0P9F4L9_9ARCH|nr:hypothetical protein SE19_04350 [Acidiplasma aeolicum]KQB33570.1 hypothetical protein AOG54_06825 [Acidiplasma aeolicum]
MVTFLNRSAIIAIFLNGNIRKHQKSTYCPILSHAHVPFTPNTPAEPKLYSILGVAICVATQVATWLQQLQHDHHANVATCQETLYYTHFFVLQQLQHRLQHGNHEKLSVS